MTIANFEIHYVTRDETGKEINRSTGTVHAPKNRTELEELFDSVLTKKEESN